MIRIAALLTCYNRVETTLRCLRQFMAQKLPDGCSIDIYLVDDASPDRTGEKVREWFATISAPAFSLNVIESSGGLFWCRGMRLAWDTAIARGIGYDYWLWLNDDVQFGTDVIRGMIGDAEEVVRRDGRAGIIVGTFVSSQADQCATYGLRNAAKEVIRPCGEPHWEEGELMNGNLVLVPKAIYEVVGPIYGGYNHGYADSDYRLMCKEHGFKAYAASSISGICPREPERYLNVKELSLLNRIRALFNPKGKSLHDTFVYRYRHWGICRAIISVVHVICITLLKHS